MCNVRIRVLRAIRGLWKQFPPNGSSVLFFSSADKRVILGADLAALYGIVTWRLNEQVKRNKARFPGDFVFQLTAEEDKR